MGKRPSTGRKLTGIYSRGKVFWLSYRLNGEKRFCSLKTGDYGEAVEKALEIRQTPELEPAAVFAAETDAHIAHKVARNEYSPDSAAVKVHALQELAAVTAEANPITVTTTDVTRLYRLLQGRVPTCSRHDAEWLSGRPSPERAKLGRVVSPRATVRLLGNKSSDELKTVARTSRARMSPLPSSG